MESLLSASHTWLDFDAPTFADTFGSGGMDSGDTWFQAEHEAQRSPDSSSCGSTMDGKDVRLMKPAKSFAIITGENEHEFFGDEPIGKMPEAIKCAPGRWFSPSSSSHVVSRSTAHVGLPGSRSMRTASGLHVAPELRSFSPASGLRVTPAKPPTVQKPFSFSKAPAIRGPARESWALRGRKLSVKIALARSINSHDCRKEQMACQRSRKSPLTKQMPGEARKRGDLTKWEPKNLSINSIKLRRAGVVTKLNANGKGGNKVSSLAATPASRARNMFPIRNASAVKDSKQQKATCKKIGAQPHGKKVTQVKPFNFATQKRHERYVKMKEMHGAGNETVKQECSAKHVSAPRMKQRTHTPLVRTSALHGPNVTRVKPFVFATQKRYEQRMAAMKMAPAVPSGTETQSSESFSFGPPSSLSSRLDISIGGNSVERPFSRGDRSKGNRSNVPLARRTTLKKQGGRYLKKKNQ